MIPSSKWDLTSSLYLLSIVVWQVTHPLDAHYYTLTHSLFIMTPSSKWYLTFFQLLSFINCCTAGNAPSRCTLLHSFYNVTPPLNDAFSINCCTAGNPLGRENDRRRCCQKASYAMLPRWRERNKEKLNTQPESIHNPNPILFLPWSYPDPILILPWSSFNLTLF